MAFFPRWPNVEARRITGTDDIAFGQISVPGICASADLAACVVKAPAHGRDEPA